MLAKLSVPLDIYNQYRCPSGSPLSCEQSLSSHQAGSVASDCPICKFPGLLAPRVKINGIQGNYQIEAFIGVRGMGRLYKGIRLIDSQPVTIKEYLLPPLYFNQGEVKTCVERFQELVTPQLVHAIAQDFRVLTADEAITDLVQRRCFFVTASAFSALTLENYIHQKGLLSEATIWEFLEQVLQSLIFLHTQVFRFPSGRLQSGITHGNLSPNSILILEKGRDFLIYLADLALWEQIFLPGVHLDLNLLSFSEAIAEDLAALGQVAFYLSTGTKFAQNGSSLAPKQENNWREINPVLSDYILSLMGLGSRNFDSAKTAREYLLKLKPAPSLLNAPLPPLIDISTSSSKSRLWRWWLAGGLLITLLLIVLLIWLRYKRGVSQSDSPLASGCCLERVDIPQGDYHYAAPENSAWHYVYTQRNLLKFDKIFKNTLEDKQPKLTSWRYRPLSTTQIVPSLIREQDFMIINPPNNLGLQYEILPFAYENLGVFVAFNYSRRQDGLPYLLKGEITINQLRQLYTGKITTWNQLNPRLPKERVYLYIPADVQGEAVFKEKVLHDRESISQYKQLKAEQNMIDRFLKKDEIIITRLRTFEMLRKIISDFENDGKISIGFDSMSKIIGQCSVYPLALASHNQAAVSPLLAKDGRALTLETDLCEQKGSYQINHPAIRNQDYPLTYPLAVVFFRDNRRQSVGRNFAELLTTTEAQCLIQEVQLTSIYPINCTQPTK